MSEKHFFTVKFVIGIQVKDLIGEFASAVKHLRLITIPRIGESICLNHELEGDGTVVSDVFIKDGSEVVECYANDLVLHKASVSDAVKWWEELGFNVTIHHPALEESIRSLAQEDGTEAGKP